MTPPVVRLELAPFDPQSNALKKNGFQKSSATNFRGTIKVKPMCPVKHFLNDDVLHDMASQDVKFFI